MEDDTPIGPALVDLGEARPFKRRAEPNSFIVPTRKFAVSDYGSPFGQQDDSAEHVCDLGRSMLDELEQQKGVAPFCSPVDLNEVIHSGSLADKQWKYRCRRTRI